MNETEVDNTVLRGATIIWDLDGTLVDTSRDILRALNEMLSAHGYPAVEEGYLRAIVGEGARATLRRALAHLGTALPEPVVTGMVAEMVGIYAAAPTRDSVLFPGMRHALQAFRDAGALQVVATNKPQELADLVISGMDLSRFITRTIGRDSAPRAKPDPSHLYKAAGLTALQARQARLLMVGDSNTDLRAARAAGMPCILMSFGYSARPVRELGADIVLDDAHAVPHHAARLLARRG